MNHYVARLRSGKLLLVTAATEQLATFRAMMLGESNVVWLEKCRSL